MEGRGITVHTSSGKVLETQDKVLQRLGIVRWHGTGACLVYLSQKPVLGPGQVLFKLGREKDAMLKLTKAVPLFLEVNDVLGCAASLAQGWHLTNRGYRGGPRAVSSLQKP